MKNSLLRIGRIFSTTFSVLLLLYLGLLLFPEIAFGHKKVYGPFVVYAHEPLPENLPAVLDSAQNLLKRSEFAGQKPETYPLFFCSNFLEYAFFSPSASRAFANNNALTGKIIFAKTNVEANRVHSNVLENNNRSLSGTIAHEVTHSQLRKAFGLRKEIQLETWKKEGYCDAIAHESSFNSKMGLRALCSSEAPASPSFQYFKYRLYVEYLLNKEQTFIQIANQSYNLQQLDQAVSQQHCR